MDNANTNIFLRTWGYVIKYSSLVIFLYLLVSFAGCFIGYEIPGSSVTDTIFFFTGPLSLILAFSMYGLGGALIAGKREAVYGLVVLTLMGSGLAYIFYIFGPANLEILLTVILTVVLFVPPIIVGVINWKKMA